jgi:hypothetical protein
MRLEGQSYRDIEAILACEDIYVSRSSLWRWVKGWEKGEVEMEKSELPGGAK